MPRPYADRSFTVTGPSSRKAATPTIGSAEYVLVAPSDELRSRRNPAVRNSASRHAKLACARTADGIRRTTDDSDAAPWLLVVAVCERKSSQEVSAESVSDDSSLSGVPVLPTLLKRSVARLALPPALPTSGPDADGSGVW